MTDNNVMAVVLTEDMVLNNLPKELKQLVTSWNHDGFFVLGKDDLFPFGTIWYNNPEHQEFITPCDAEKLLTKAKAVHYALEDLYHGLARRSLDEVS